MYDIRVRECGGGAMLIELRGEFDLFALEDLQKTLGGATNLRKPTVVDLSGVTFLDIQSARELAVRSHLYGHHLSFRNPSPHAEASVRACKLESWFRFCRDEDPPADRPTDHPGEEIISAAS